MRTGRCLCGAVSFTVEPEAHPDGLHVDACHCGMCRRQVGGPLMGVMLKAAPKIENDAALATYASSEWAERQFCSVCGSNLFFRMKDGSLHMVNAGALDDLSDALFTEEVFIDEKPAFYDFAQDTKKMTGAQVMAMFVKNGD